MVEGIRLLRRESTNPSFNPASEAMKVAQALDAMKKRQPDQRRSFNEMRVFQNGEHRVEARINFDSHELNLRFTSTATMQPIEGTASTRLEVQFINSSNVVVVGVSVNNRDKYVRKGIPPDVFLERHGKIYLDVAALFAHHWSTTIDTLPLPPLVTLEFVILRK